MEYTAQKLWKVPLNPFQAVWIEVSKETTQETCEEDRLSAVWFSATAVPLDLLVIIHVVLHPRVSLVRALHSKYLH